MKTLKMFKQKSFFPPRFMSSALRSVSHISLFVWRRNILTCPGCHASLQWSESASASEVGPQRTVLTHQRQAKVTPYVESLHGVVFTYSVPFPDQFFWVGPWFKQKLLLPGTQKGNNDNIRIKTNHTEFASQKKHCCSFEVVVGCGCSFIARKQRRQHKR